MARADIRVDLGDKGHYGEIQYFYSRNKAQNTLLC
jgi:hypothetical protein